MEKEEVLLPPINEEDWMWCGLCYPFWFIFSPWTLKTEKKNELFVYFHALQGLHFGIFTSISTLVAFLIAYLVFFRPNIEQLSLTTGEQLNSRLMCGTIGIVVLLLSMLFLTVILFMTLYYGWRAASGKMFKIPFIGKFAWEAVYKKKHEVEADYFNSPLGKMELRAKQRTGAIPVKESYEPYREETDSSDYKAPISMKPEGDFEKHTPLKADGEVDYEALLIQSPPIDKIKSIFSPPQEEIIVEDEQYEEQYPPREETQLSPLEKLALLRKQQTQEQAPEEYYEEEPVEEEIIEESIPGEEIVPLTEPGEETPMIFREDLQNLSPQEQIALLRQQQEVEKKKAMKAASSPVKEEIVKEPVNEVPQPRPTSYLDPKEAFFRIQQQRLGMTDPDKKEPSEELKEVVSSAPPVEHLSPLEQLSQMRKQHRERQEQLGFTEDEQAQKGKKIPRASATSRLDPSVLFMSKDEDKKPQPPARKPSGGKPQAELSPLKRLSILRKRQKEMEEAKRVAAMQQEESVKEKPAPIATTRLDPSVLLSMSGKSQKAGTPGKRKEKPLSHIDKLAKLQQKKQKKTVQKPRQVPGSSKPAPPAGKKGGKKLSPLEQLALRRKQRNKNQPE